MSDWFSAHNEATRRIIDLVLQQSQRLRDNCDAEFESAAWDIVATLEQRHPQLLKDAGLSRATLDQSVLTRLRLSASYLRVRAENLTQHLRDLEDEDLPSAQQPTSVLDQDPEPESEDEPTIDLTHLSKPYT